MSKIKAVKSDGLGVITTPQADASEAGYAILREGGTAIDALIAAGAILAVTTPHMTGLGGDAIWIVNDGIKTDTIVGIGQAGRQLPAAGRIEERGTNAIATTAAAVASWDMAYRISRDQWHSHIPWSRLIGPAYEMARDGYTVTGSQLFWQSQRENLYKQYPKLQPFWCRDDGGPRRAGDQIRLPALANSLQSIARNGADDFYHGEVAHALAEGFRQDNICLDIQDLEVTRALQQAPISIRYRKGMLYNVAPPTQGVTTLQAMVMLGHLERGKLSSNPAFYYHAMIEAVKQALRDRNRSLCDPEFCQYDGVKKLADEQHNGIGIEPGMASDWQEPSFPADTVWMAAIDQEGHSASLIQSLYYDWGSACTIGDTGILWHNRAAGFSPTAGHPNAWAPGKRPAHTLNPSLYVADNGERILFGSQGGDGQPQTQLVLATQLIDFGHSVEQALYAPRFLQGKSFFDSRDNLKLESSLSIDIVNALTVEGHDIEQIPALSPLAGLAGIARIDPDGVMQAMHDPRGDGLSLAVQDADIA